MTTRKNSRHGFDTRLIHAGEAPDPATGAHGVPLYQNTTYAFRSYDQVLASNRGEVPHYFYQRYGNPTVRCLELKIADLEGAGLSVGAATGVAAISSTLEEVVGCGGHVIAADDLYQVTHELLDRDLPDQQGEVTKVDITDLDAVRAAVCPDTKAIFCETLSNPRIDVADVPALAAIAHDAGALLVVDNTFLSPALYRPLEDGADLVIHSATKYLSGTGQIMGGFVSGSTDLVGRVGARLSRQGGTLSPFAAWQILAGIKTLSLRMDRHSSSASSIANLLESHPAVREVRFPALESHKGSETARRIANGRYGGLLSFVLDGGESATRAFIDSLRLFTIAVSLGEATSLIWPYSDGTIRMSVGLEDVGDLVRDVENALEIADRT